MKVIKKARKLVIGINIVLVVIVCAVTAFATLAPLQFEKAFEDFVDAGFFSLNRGVLFLVVLLILTLDVFFIISLFEKDEKVTESVTINNGAGQISIAVYSLEALAIMEVKQYEKVSDIRAKIIMKENDVSMDIYVKVLPTVLIPQLSSEIQAKVKEKIQIGTGIELKQVRVFVDGIAEIS
jgi:hypothetical protein